MKKPLLFTLLLLLAAFAWADTYVIGTGTSASGLYPIYGYYDYSWSKQVYTAAEINAAGLNEAASITGIGLYVGNTPANFVMADQRIYLRHSTLTTYTTVTDETGTGYPANSGFSQVFQGTLTFNGGGWIYITFDTAFAWNNTDNIEILWENWCLAGVTGYPTFRYTSTSPDYRNVYKYQDGSFPAVAGTRSTSRPNITIVTPSVDPPNPALLVYPYDDSYAFLDGTLAWADGGGMPTSYDLYFDTVDPPVSLVGDDLVTTTYTPTLAAGTTYYWKVVPYNANGPATGVTTWSFKTPTATQLAESFDATAFPPAGWANPGAFTRSTTSPFYGAANIYKSASTTPALISTPMLAINASSALDFFYRTSSTTGYGLLNVKYSTDRETWNQIGATISMPITTTWNHANVALGAIPAGNYYLAFEVLTSTSTSSIYIDHVFGPELAAIAPDAVTLTAPADAAIDIAIRPTFTWTAPTLGGVPTGYRVYCDTNANPTTQIADVATLTYTATTALAYSTTYYWKVVAYNGNGSSADSAIRSFTTVADPTIYTMPWLEDFGTTGTTFPPTNWTRWSGALADPSVLASGSTIWGQDNWLNDTSVTPVNYSARMNIYSTARYHWIITPPIQMPGAGYQLEFDMGLTDYGNGNVPEVPSPDDRFIVLIGDGVTWTPANVLREYNNTGSPYVYDTISNLGEHLIFPLDSYTGIKHIAFYGESTVSNADNDFFVDNVMIRLTPAGAPEHVTLVAPVDGATGVYPESTTLSWTPALTGGTPAYYEVYVGADPIDPGIGYYGEYFYETENANLDLSAQSDIDLAYNSTWYWAVLPYNSDGLAPDPDNPAFMVWDFTIIEDPTIVTLPHQEYFDSVTAPALPYGWTSVVEATTTYAYVNTYSSTTYAVSAPNSARLYNSTDIAANLLLITPDFSMPLNTMKVRFYARSSTAGEDLYIGAYNPTTQVFTQIGAVMDLTTTQTQYTVPLSAYVGTDVFLAFKHGVGTSSRTIYIDNVEFIEMMAIDLAATTITGSNILEAGVSSDFVVTVYNEGTTTINPYDVQLKRIGDDMYASVTVTEDLAPGATAQITIPWTPAIGGVYQLYGKVVATGDGNAANDETPLKEVYVLDNTMTVIPVGDDATTTSGYYVPISMYYKNGVTEELYFTDEMHLQSGNITALVYKNTFVTNLVDKPIKIWLAHTTVTDLSGGWLPALDYTLVFDGTVDFPSGVNYIVIPLDTPFAYTGGTLATRVYRPMDAVYYSTSDKFYYTTNPAHTLRSRYLHSDSTTYDPLAPSAAGTTLGYFPNTTFVVQNAVMQTGAVLNGYVYEAGGTTPVAGATVTLTDERYSATTDAAGFYEFTFWEAHTVTASASKVDYYNSTPVTGIALTMGVTVSQNLYLQPLPDITVSGVVTSNDYPAGLVGATVELFGYHNYSTTTGAGGVFSIADVKGSVDILAYTWEVSKAGYASASGSFNAIETNVDLGTINLTEYLWTPYELVASHEGDNARLNWEAAGAPEYYFTDFETDNGGWVISSNWTGTALPNYPDGDWQWTNTYNVANYNTAGGSSPQNPPATAYSGTGMWGTVIYGPYTNLTVSGQRSFLRQTFDLSVYPNPVISLWHHMDGYNTWDYGQIMVNGTAVWGTSDLAVFMPWQQITVDLSAYASLTNAEISFEWSSTTVSNYAGWYIDDIYIGPAATKQQTAQFGERNDDRVFLNYSVYRRNPGAAWNLLNDAVADTTYLDTGFGSVPEGQYEWGVKANYSGTLQSDEIVSNILGKFIDAPVIDASSTVASGSNVTLGWLAEPGASYYIIYGAHDPYGTYTIVGYSATNSYVYSATTDGFHFFKIAAADGEMPATKNK